MIEGLIYDPTLFELMKLEVMDGVCIVPRIIEEDIIVKLLN